MNLAGRVAVLIGLSALSAVGAEDGNDGARFADGPRAERVDGQARVAFTASRVTDVAVAGGRALARHPAFGAHTATSFAFDAEGGAATGSYTPQTPEGRNESMWNLLYGEMVGGKDGNLYVQTGKGHLRRYVAQGRPLPFAATGSYVLEGFHHGHTHPAGLFADRRGTIYVPMAPGNRELAEVRVQVVSSAGEIIDSARITTQNARLGGIATDPAGNIYLGAQVAPKGKRIPAWAAGKLPPDGPEHHPSIDFEQCGAVLQFPPSGGAILADPNGSWEAHLGWKTEGPVTLRDVRWVRRIGLHPVKHEIGCFCETTRFDVDAYGRLFVPDVFRFSAFALDAAGNTLARIGSYGNMDSRGAGSPVPDPEVAFGWPLCVECARGRLYVADTVNRRVVAVRFEHDATAECSIE